MKIPLVPDGLPLLAGALLVSVALAAAAVWGSWGRPLTYLASSSFCLLFILVWFFRDPERGPEPKAASLTAEGKDFIISPADGRISDIVEQGGMRRIGIFLSIFDCHVQRVPLAGKVSDVYKKDGLFLAAFKEDASKLNASSTVTVENPGLGTYKVRQLTGLLARRIITHVKKGDSLKTGERYGMILLGSRVELELPQRAELHKGVGDTVRAGETVLASYVQ